MDQALSFSVQGEEEEEEEAEYVWGCELIN
jgi:hypothetical protein